MSFHRVNGNNLCVSFHMGVEDPSKSANFQVLAFETKTDDTCLPNKDVHQSFSKVCYVLTRSLSAHLPGKYGPAR